MCSYLAIKIDEKRLIVPEKLILSFSCPHGDFAWRLNPWEITLQSCINTHFLYHQNHITRSERNKWDSITNCLQVALGIDDKGTQISEFKWIILRFL